MKKMKQQDIDKQRESGVGCIERAMVENSG